MKRITTLLLVLTIILSSCSGTQKTQKAIDSGNYDAAFHNAIEKLTKDKNKYEKQVPLLKDAFKKAEVRDLAAIKRLKSQKPADLKGIYNTYMSLDARQDEIILLEPLYFDGKQISFSVNDYSNDIATAKKNYADEMYSKASPLMYNSKENSRKAFKILEEIQYVDPNYRSDLAQLITSAKKRGSDYIFVKLHNKVASQLQDSASLNMLKQFAMIRSGDFKNKWIVLHDKKDYSVIYDYQADIYLDKFTAIPEKEVSQKVREEKEIQTGWIYKKDAKGNVMKDKDGNDIKSAKMEKVYADVTIFKQSKANTLDGKVVIKNLKTGAVANQKAIKGEAKLENVYATYKGEPKAIDEKYYKALKNKKQQFPPDEKFNEFALQTFKLQVEQFLAEQKL